MDWSEEGVEEVDEIVPGVHGIRGDFIDYVHRDLVGFAHLWLRNVCTHSLERQHTMDYVLQWMLYPSILAGRLRV